MAALMQPPLCKRSILLSLVHRLKKSAAGKITKLEHRHIELTQRPPRCDRAKPGFRVIRRSCFRDFRSKSGNKDQKSLLLPGISVFSGGTFLLPGVAAFFLGSHHMTSFCATFLQICGSLGKYASQSRYFCFQLLCSRSKLLSLIHGSAKIGPCNLRISR